MKNKDNQYREGNLNMNFNEAYQKMLEGKKIKRPDWKGYWFIDSKDNKFKIKLAGGEIKENKFTQETIKNTAANDWEIVEEPKSKVYKPKPQGMYYFLAGDGTPTAKHNLDDGSVEKFISIGNCFKTGEEAKHMVEKLKVIKELQDFAIENRDEEIDWYDKEQDKWEISYKDSNVEPICNNYYRAQAFNIYFTSLEIAKEAIKTIGEDRIKKYYFDIED